MFLLGERREKYVHVSVLENICPFELVIMDLGQRVL